MAKSPTMTLTTSASSALLTGCRVLNTRPKAQAKQLTKLLTAHGASVSLLPTIIIEPIDSDSLNAIWSAHNLQHIIFTSANAVEYSQAYWPPDLATSHPSIIAIGPGTRAQLVTSGIKKTIIPDNNFTSEGVLALPILQDIHNQQILISTGENSRPLLATTLAKRGAEVLEACCYRRQPTTFDASQDWPALQTADPEIIICTSLSSFDALFNMLSPQHTTWLQQKQFVVINQKMALRVKTSACQKDPIVADNASDQAVLAALISWYTHASNG